MTFVSSCAAAKTYARSIIYTVGTVAKAFFINPKIKPEEC
jgi:hypothetical protein